jgi:O-6-methylguanine DNA methyltransferase
MSIRGSRSRTATWQRAWASRELRAVGQALRRNPLPLVWPCHRVVAKNGLGGFGGCPPDSDADPLEIKRWLLDHERDALRER